jgi:hypothetical protein
MPCSQSTGLSPELYEFQLLIISLVSIYVSLQIQHDHFQMNIEQDSLRTLPQLRAGSGQDSQRTEGLRHVCECRYRCRHRYPSMIYEHDIQKSSLRMRPCHLLMLTNSHVSWSSLTISNVGQSCRTITFNHLKCLQ